MFVYKYHLLWSSSQTQNKPVDLTRGPANRKRNLRTSRNPHPRCALSRSFLCPTHTSSQANTKHSEDTPLSPVPDTDADSLFSGPEQPSSPNIALSQFPASATDQPGASTSAMNTSTGGPSTTKTVRTLPAHKERQANPKVKMMDFSEVGMSSANAIPTKQRIAQGGSGSSVAKSTTLPPLVIPPKKSLAGMSFKKKQSMTKPASPAVPSASSTTISAMTDNTATAIQSRFADNQDVVQSPASMFSNEGWGSPAQNSPDIGSPSSSRMPPPQTQPTRDPR